MTQRPLMVLVLVLTFTYSAGQGPMPYVLKAETVPLCVHGLLSSMAFASDWIAFALIASLGGNFKA